MKFLKNRVLPFVCVFSLLLSLCIVPVSAAWGDNDAYLDGDEVDVWTARVLTPSNSSVYGEYMGWGASLSPVDIFWNYVDMAIGLDTGLVSLGRLNELCSNYVGFFNRDNAASFFEQLRNGTGEFLADCFGLAFLGAIPTFEIREHPSSGLLRMYCPEVDAWVVNSLGEYAYYDPNTSDETVADQWIGEVTAADRATKEVAIHSLDRLNMMCLQLRDAGIPAQIKTLGTNYKCIWYNRQVYANADGVPYVAWFDEDKAAVNQDRPTTNVTENGDIIEGDLTDNSTNIDLENMLITLPNGAINIIDQIIYDESTKSYHIDSHDTYNYTVNNYYTWNYYINYTSITYIGQTEEYNKYYEVYYELPDGRDSADLTKEDLEQLNLSVDVIPYGRSADDTSLRSLYHFDGDTHDASYWNYCTDFTWNTGASLTYMDAGVFDGALYLDETEHDFTLTLPSNITAGDFTLQFRYYQSYTATPAEDSYIQFGGSTVFQFYGSKFLNASGSLLAATPIGSWNELALIRNNGTLYYYLNGVSIGSVSDTASYSNTITFHFGGDQQTYKYFDELRFLNYALQTGGANYECTSVPHDTNLALVLPDSVVPVADEYLKVTPDPDALSFVDFTQGVIPDNVFSSALEDKFASVNDPFPLWNYVTDVMSISCYDGYASLSRISSTLADSGHYVTGLRTCVAEYDAEWWDREFKGGFSLGEYTVTIVFPNGSCVAVPVTYSESNQTTTSVFTASYDWGTVVLRRQSTSAPYYVYLSIVPPADGTPLDIAAIEVTAGNSSSLTAEYVNAVVPLTPEQFKTPTLAVRTDIDITSYQIGGVRPSVPTKGQVWALVENERITSIQIYNGQAWEGVDGRIWTGSRWIPASSYNIVTLQDMYDIVDATPDYEYIYTESGFWSWWQKSWNAFTEKLFSLLGTGGTGGSSGATGGSGSSGLKDVDLDKDVVSSDPDQEDSKSLWQFIVLVIDGGKSVVGGVRHLFSGVVSTIPDTMVGITGAFDSGGVAVGLMDGTGSDPDVSVETYSSAEGEVLDPWRYR